MLAITCSKHCSVTCDCYHCVSLNQKNFNDFCIECCINCLAVKVKCECNSINYNGFCKSNICKNNYCSTVSRINCCLKCCIFCSVYFCHCSSIQAICRNSEICFFTICFKDNNIACKRTAVNGKLTNLTLESVYSTTGDRCHRYSTFTACSVDESYVTTTDIDSTGCRSCKRCGSCLCPNSTCCACNSTTGNVKNSFSACAMAILFHTVTDSSVCRIKHATIDVSSSITVPVAAVINNPSHIGSAKVLKCTVLYCKNAAAVVEDCRHCIPCAVCCRCKLDSTVTDYCQATVDVEQFVIVCLIVCYSDLLAVHIKSDRNTICDSICFRINYEICKKNDCIAINCCCHCFSKCFKFLFANLSYCYKSRNEIIIVRVTTC